MTAAGVLPASPIETITYDASDRHMTTTLDDGTIVSYLRDATGRLVQRTVTGSP